MDIEIVGYVAGFLSCITFVPQIFKTFQTKSVKDVSLNTFFIIAISTLLWLYYGIEQKLYSVIFTNIVVFLSAVAMISMKYIYSKEDS